MENTETVLLEKNFNFNTPNAFDFSIGHSSIEDVPEVVDTTPQDLTKETPEEVEAKRVEEEKVDKEQVELKLAQEKGKAKVPNPQEEESQEDQEVVEEAPSTIFKAIGENFQEEGLITLPEDYDGSEEQFKQAFSSTVDQLADTKIIDYFKDHPQSELAKNLFNYIKDNKDLNVFIQNNSNPLASIDLKNESDQERVIRDNLKLTTRLSEEQIKLKIDSYKNSALLESEAKDALDNLTLYNQSQAKAREAQEDQRVKAEQEQEVQARRELEDFVNTKESVKDIFSIRTPGEKKKVLEYLFKPVVRLEDGRMVSQALADDINESTEDWLADKINRMNKYNPEGISKIEKKVKTKLAENLEKLSKNNTKIKGTGSAPKEEEEIERDKETQRSEEEKRAGWAKALEDSRKARLMGNNP